MSERLGDRKQLTLLIKPIDNKKDEVQEFYTNHGTFHIGDAGLDLFCLQDLLVPAHAYSVKMPLGVCIAAYKTIHNTDSQLVQLSGSAFYLYPRSSTGSRTPIRLSNSVGIIDSQYRGEITAVLDNLSSDDYIMHKGERYFQICAPDLCPIQFELVDELDKTSRGTGGFGSTGK
jgi:dUTP pyrophosphatase